MWAIEHAGVEPDVLIAAKGIASGLPLGAFLARDELWRWPKGAHGSTYGGSPVPCAAGLATLEVLRDERLLDNATAMGELLREGLERLRRRFGWLVEDVRGTGRRAGGRVPHQEAGRGGPAGLPLFRQGLLVLEQGRASASRRRWSCRRPVRTAYPAVHRGGRGGRGVVPRPRSGRRGRGGRRWLTARSSMRDAISELVRDGDTLAIEGFTHLIGFAAGHEVIRQRKQDLTLCRLTPDVVYDQMVGARVARKLVFSWMGNPGWGRCTPSGAGSSTTTRPRWGWRSTATSAWSEGMPPGRQPAVLALRSYFETDLPRVNPNIRPVTSPFGGEPVYAVPPLRPDVAIVHAQRADAAGDTQIWGLTGCQKEAAFAAGR